MSYNTKNYTEQGGDKTVIGGTLEIKQGATVVGLSSSSEITAATKTKLGGIKADSKAETDTVGVKIGTDQKLYVPTYPDAVNIPVAENQALSTAEDIEALVTDFNGLLTRLKAAGIMTPDTP